MSISTFVDFLFSKDIPGVNTHAEYLVHIGEAKPEYDVSDAPSEEAMRIAPNGPTDADYKRWAEWMPAGSICPTCGQPAPPERAVITERDRILGKHA